MLVLLLYKCIVNWSVGACPLVTLQALKWRKSPPRDLARAARRKGAGAQREKQVPILNAVTRLSWSDKLLAMEVKTMKYVIS